MFDDLFDDSPDSDGPDVAAAPADARDNGRLGATHSQGARRNIKLAAAHSRVAISTKKSYQFADAAKPTFSKHVVSNCFSNQTTETTKVLMVNGTATQMLAKRTGKRSGDAQRCYDYGDLAGIDGQAVGLAHFFGYEPSRVHGIISTNIFDDASMWMKDPCTAAERLALPHLCPGTKIAGKLWKR
jgi:hypothetical protein